MSSSVRGRVVVVERVYVTVVLESAETIEATVRGEFHETGEYPKVGDWVTVTFAVAGEGTHAVIEEILPRTSTIARLDQETRQPQILVTNVDIVFIVAGLDGDFNVKRIERYLLLARQSNIQPIVVLNKADIEPDATLKKEQIEIVADGAPVLVVSAATGEGLAEMRSYIQKDTTAVLLGSSGAGKSTITNWLLGETAQETNAVRLDDSRGRHTTTTRELFSLPDGGFLIDTPGMRELGLIEAEAATDDRLIAQVEELATQCKFSNCDHHKSAGCAVLAAIDSGELEEASLENYYKLERERAWLQDKTSNKQRFTEQKETRSAKAAAAAMRRRLSGRG